MKKFSAIVLGLSLTLSTANLMIASDKPADKDHKEHKDHKDEKKKDEKKKP